MRFFAFAAGSVSTSAAGDGSAGAILASFGSNATAGAASAITPAAVADRTTTWDGPPSGAWETPENWSGDALPGAADDVCIPADNTVTHSTGTDAILSSQSSGSFTLSGGTLELTGDSAHESTATTFTHSGGTLAGTGTLSVLGSMTWTGGTETDAGTTRIAPTASLAIDPIFNVVLSGGRTLENDGAATWTGVDIFLGGAATWTGVDIFENCCGFEPLIHNDGSLTRTTTGETADPTGVHVPLDNDGTLAASAGTLELHDGDGGGLHSRSFAGTTATALVSFTTLAALLAEAIYAQGRYEEAERFTLASEEAAAEEDAASQVGWRLTRAKVLARGGEDAGAERLAREAVEIAAETDFLVLHAAALLARAARAEVLSVAGRPQEVAPLVEEALGLFRQKGNVAAAARAEWLTAEWEAGAPAA